MGMTAAQESIGDGSTSLWLFESQWDKIWCWPHDVEISPYDPDKNIQIVDAGNHFVSGFTHNGKQRILALGTPGVHRRYAFRRKVYPRVVYPS